MGFPRLEGTKEVLGLWIEGSEGAKFWLKTINELKNRGVEDIFIVCCDGLKGFPEAIEAVFPKTVVQTCIVHMIRNSTRYVAYKDRKAVSADLKPVYTAASRDDALEALGAFDKTWGERYPMIAQSWMANWERLVPFLDFPPDIRKVIYTTNAIESVNSQIRKLIKNRGHFPISRFPERRRGAQAHLPRARQRREALDHRGGSFLAWSPTSASGA